LVAGSGSAFSDVAPCLLGGVAAGSALFLQWAGPDLGGGLCRRLRLHLRGPRSAGLRSRRCGPTR